MVWKINKIFYFNLRKYFLVYFTQLIGTPRSVQIQKDAENLASNVDPEILTISIHSLRESEEE